MGKLTVEQQMRERSRGQKAAREGRPRSWSEPCGPNDAVVVLIEVTTIIDFSIIPIFNSRLTGSEVAAIVIAMVHSPRSLGGMASQKWIVRNNYQRSSSCRFSRDREGDSADAHAMSDNRNNADRKIAAWVECRGR
jgi:hypothetical protein